MDNVASNIFANCALLLWPLVALFLYRSKPLVPATLWTILAGQLFLPVGTFFKIPMIPQFDKNSIPSLCALVGCVALGRRPIRLLQKLSLVDIVLCAYLLSPAITSLLNNDPIRVGTTVLPGVGLYDGVSAAIGQFIAIIPFMIGRRFLCDPRRLPQILYILSLAGLLYSVFLLFEIRFSPQLHFWLYGYYPSNFIQEMRGDGAFRPMAFLGHGLIASFFTMTTILASASLWRSKRRVAIFRSDAVTAYLGIVLVLCKSGAALMYGLVLTPIIRWTAPRFQLRIAVVLVTLALCYPALRIAEIFPTDSLVALSSTFSEDRASSLKFRFDQEEKLLDHASQRPWFGWGRYGRNRVYVENWKGIGVDASTTDGRWIISFGQYGFCGFLAEFLLLAIPVFYAATANRRRSLYDFTPYQSALALIVSINMIDLLPNSALSPWTWLLAGALVGTGESVRNKRIKYDEVSEPLRTSTHALARHENRQ